MNEKQAVEMLNLLREMNAKLDKIDSLETRFDRLEAKVDAGFRRLDDKVEALSDTIPLLMVYSANRRHWMNV